MTNFETTPQQPAGRQDTSQSEATRLPEATSPAASTSPSYSESTSHLDATSSEPTGPVQRPEVKRSTAGSTWVALIIGALLLILLLVFIMQNQENVQLHLFGWEASFPIGVGMLIASVIGGLIMALVGGVRIMQLRRQIRHALD